MLALMRKVTLRAYIINLLEVVACISGGTSDGLYLYSGDLNEVTVSICLISERSLLIGSCQIEYRQLRSMHSNGDSEDEENKAHDLGGKRVLVSETFAYFGSESLPLPTGLRSLIVQRGHRSRFSDEIKAEFIRFAGSVGFGVHGAPRQW